MPQNFTTRKPSRQFYVYKYLNVQTSSSKIDYLSSRYEQLRAHPLSTIVFCPSRLAPTTRFIGHAIKFHANLTRQLIKNPSNHLLPKGFCVENALG